MINWIALNSICSRRREFFFSLPGEDDDKIQSPCAHVKIIFLLLSRRRRFLLAEKNEPGELSGDYFTIHITPRCLSESHQGDESGKPVLREVMLLNI
jgi:hypothetical protein